MSIIDHHYDAEGLDADDSIVATAAGTNVEAGWLARMSVAGKLNLAVFGNTLVLAFVALVMLAMTAILAEQGRDYAVVAAVEARGNNAAIALADTINALEVNDDGSVAQTIADARAHLDFAYASLTDPIEFGGDRMPAALGEQVHGYRDRISVLIERIDSGDLGAQGSDSLRRDTKTLYTELSGFAVYLRIDAKAKGDAIFASITNFLAFFFAVTVIGVAISLIGARKISRDLSGMIGSITAAMDKIAQGQTDTAIPGEKREDEIGDMARSLGTFRNSMLELRDLNNERARNAEHQLEQQRKLAEEMRNLRLEKSELLEDMADGFEVSVGELINAVSAASVQLKATSEQMVALAAGSNEQANGASEAMARSSANVTAAAAATDEFALSISEISRQAASSASLARDATKLVSTANTRMTDLSLAADEIGEIASLIQTIAQRTNLLALNASIEAARGGEAGRGFAVVASEVKELAMQTSSATSSVAERIAAMQATTRSSAADLTSIVEQIGEVEQAAVMIASAVDQQSVSGEELASNIDTVAAGTNQVSDRLTALREASEETGTAAQDVVASANALGNHADDLRTKAGHFIDNVRRSARELEQDGGREGAA